MPIVSVEDFVKTTFDYVVAGGGTTGLVVAARLSEDSKITVGVIEAGSDHRDSPAAIIPGLGGTAMFKPDHDWSFMSVPQKAANGRAIAQPRGKGLGGSSMLNFSYLSRPSKADIDALELLGNKGWNWDSLLPYFNRCERYVAMEDRGLSKELGIEADPSAHGADGPIPVSVSPWISPLHGVFAKAFNELGLPYNVEPANGINAGLTTAVGSIDSATATRSYSASAYLFPNEGRKNLLVLTDALVSKVLFKPEPQDLRRCVGVEFLLSDKTFKVSGVRKDVILSAGTVQTPVLLELSGIGDPRILKGHDIETVIDLPGVGENLQDHVVSPMIAEVNKEKDTLDIMRDPVRAAEHQELYKSRQGILASLSCNQYAYIPAAVIQDAKTIERWQARVLAEADEASLSPNVRKQYEIIRRWISDKGEATVEILGFPGHFIAPQPQPVPGKRYYSLIASIMHPLSRGSVHISSANPNDAPTIDPRYLSHPLDIDMLVAGIRFVRNICKTQALKDDFVGFVLPKVEGFDDDEALKAHVRETMWCSFHLTGTASMLPRADRGVVDPELKVYGTTNLRVIDCSILPLNVSAHTQAIAYAIGEKGADILKDAHKH